MIISYFKLFVLALLSTVLVLTVRKQTPELGLLLSLAACLLAVFLLSTWLKPILELFHRLRARTGLDESLTEPLLKVLGIGLLTQITSALCSDAGQSAMAKLLELGGGLLCLYLSIPLLDAVLSLIEGLL